MITIVKTLPALRVVVTLVAKLKVMMLRDPLIVEVGVMVCEAVVTLVEASVTVKVQVFEGLSVMYEGKLMAIEPPDLNLVVTAYVMV